MIVFYRMISKRDLMLFCNYRCVLPELKSLALGMHALVARTLGKLLYL